MPPKPIREMVEKDKTLHCEHGVYYKDNCKKCKPLESSVVKQSEMSSPAREVSEEEIAKTLYEADVKLNTASGQRDYVPWTDLLESMTKTHYRMLATAIRNLILGRRDNEL